MWVYSEFILLLLALFRTTLLSADLEVEPSVFVVLLIRNKAHSLPYFLQYFQNLDYPKERLTLWIKTDHNIDNSRGLVKQWISTVENKYHAIHFDAENCDNCDMGYSDEKGPCHWSTDRFTNVIRLKQEALDYARVSLTDYILYLDADNFLLNPDTLNILVSVNKPIVAPMLNNTVKKQYSNFWGAMDDEGYYSRSTDYFSILHRHVIGNFAVAMVHSTVLIDLRKKETVPLAFHPAPPDYGDRPFDDIIIFAHSAKQYGVPMHIVNQEFFGFMLVPMGEDDTLPQEVDQLNHLLITNIISSTPLSASPALLTLPPKSRLGFDKIYVINLRRRPDRREKMVRSLELLGADFQLIEAVDGKEINETFLSELNVKMLPSYLDPYHKRPLTFGEIGCFLSHYFIWKEVLEEGLDQVMVLEDDVRFEFDFKTRLSRLLAEIGSAQFDWDLLYLGRKRLNSDAEFFVEEISGLVHPYYSYWTVGYLLSFSGAQKLMAQNPLEKMLPVDEYLPIMFDKHNREDWKSAFEPRDLRAFSAEPLLIYPTHYTGENGYITDTEDSQVLRGATPNNIPRATNIEL